MANDAKHLVVLLWDTYDQSHDQKNWPSEELRDILEALVRYVFVFSLNMASKHQRGWIWISILQDICRFVDDNLLRDLTSDRIRNSKTDPSELQKYKKALDVLLERYKVSIFIQSSLASADSHNHRFLFGCVTARGHFFTLLRCQTYRYLCIVH